MPGFTTVQAIFGLSDLSKSRVLCAMYGILSLLLLIIVASFYGILHLIDPEFTNNIYMGVIISVTVLILIVCCANMRFLITVMIQIFFQGCCGFWRDDVKPYITLQHFLLYPVLVVISPFFIVLVKLRVIFPSNWFVKTQKLLIGLGEAVWEASPQLTLQLYIILTTFDQGVSRLQLMAIISSSISLVIPAIQLYIQRDRKPVMFRQILAHVPLFFTANIFRILSVTILLIFLTLPWFILFILLSGFVYFFISTVSAVGSGDGDAAIEAATQGWIRLTNLEVDWNTEDDEIDSNPAERKHSFIWYLALYSIPLVIINIICNTNPNMFVFNIAHWDYYSWAELSLVSLDNGVYLNIIIWSTIGVGILGVLLDLLYYKCGHGVFIFQNIQAR